MHFAGTACRSAPAALFLVLAGCTSEGQQTLGPTPRGEGITIYVHAGFAGPSQAVNYDVADLAKVEGPCGVKSESDDVLTWGDCVSSVRVEEGWAVTLYRDDNFKGPNVTLTADVANLKDVPGPCDGSFNDCVSSFRVSRR